MNKIEAYLKGYTEGDGNLYSSLNNRGYPKVEICWCDKNKIQLEKIQKILEKIFNKKLHLKKVKKYYVLKCGHKKIFSYIKGLLKTNIWICRRPLIKKFIRGFFDAEGCVRKTYQIHNSKKYPFMRLTITQKNKKILEEIRKFLLILNIKSALIRKWHQTGYELYITSRNAKMFYDEIGFEHPDKVAKFCSSPS